MKSPSLVNSIPTKCHGISQPCAAPLRNAPPLRPHRGRRRPRRSPTWRVGEAGKVEIFCPCLPRNIIENENLINTLGGFTNKNELDDVVFIVGASQIKVGCKKSLDFRDKNWDLEIFSQKASGSGSINNICAIKMGGGWFMPHKRSRFAINDAVNAVRKTRKMSLYFTMMGTYIVSNKWVKSKIASLAHQNGNLSNEH